MGSIRDNALILYLDGELDHHSAETAKEAIDNMLQRYRFKKVIFNLTELAFIDSSGIGVFYGRRKIIKANSGKCALVGINSKIDRFIKVSGLDKMFDVYPTEDDALCAWEDAL